MKRIVFFLAIICFTKINAQDLTGIWTGTFYTTKLEMIYGSNNRYEVQINNVGRLANGVSYSYGSNSFFGKSSLVGMWTPSTKNIVFKENKLLEYKNADSNTVEMFTCYLEYRKEGDKEILEGDYSTEMNKSHKPGGGGKIYLEKTTVSAFKKEDFILKKEKEVAKKEYQKDHLRPVTEQIKPKTITTKPNVVADSKPKPMVAEVKPSPKPAKPVTAVVVTKPKPVLPPVLQKPITITPQPSKPDVVKADPPQKTTPIPIELPKIIKDRTNELFKTILVSTNEIEVNFYDNGEIDGDTISVYLNGKQIGSHRGLSTEPITYKIKIDENNPDQEIVMVAENMGTIPPNTALMIVKVGGKRYDVNLSSNEQKNAMVRFKFKKE